MPVDFRSRAPGPETLRMRFLRRHVLTREPKPCAKLPHINAGRLVFERLESNVDDFLPKALHPKKLQAEPTVFLFKGPQV